MPDNHFIFIHRQLQRKILVYIIGDFKQYIVQIQEQLIIMTESSSEFKYGDMADVSEYHDYRQLARHGQTAIGTIAGFGRRWFVKSLVPELAESTQARQTLRKEFEILLTLNHPGVVRALEITEIDGVGPSIIMEYIEGENLAEAGSKLSRKEKRIIGRQLVDTLAYIHSKGITHGDLKPENIIIENTGSTPRIRIIDFNLSDSGQFIVNKEAGGNRKYAAPEQFDKGYRLHPSADVWSLGILLQELSPPLSWKPAIRKSLVADPTKRMPDGGAVKRSLVNSSRWLNGGVAGFLIFSIITAAIIFILSPALQNRETNPPSSSGAKEQVTTDKPEEVAGVESHAPNHVESDARQSSIIQPESSESNVAVPAAVTAGQPKASNNRWPDFERLDPYYKKAEAEVKALLAEGSVEIEKAYNEPGTMKQKYTAACKAYAQTELKAQACIREFRSKLPPGYEWGCPDEWKGLLQGIIIGEYDKKYHSWFMELQKEVVREREAKAKAKADKN